MKLDKTPADGFYKLLFSLALPIMLQNLICFSLNLLDSIMIGRLGDADLSAVTLAGQPFFILSLFFFGIGSGASVLISQYWGKHDTKTIAGVISICSVAVTVISLFFAAAVILFPVPVMSIYTNNAVLQQKGAEYLRIIGFSYPFTALTTTFALNMRSLETVKIPLCINILAIATNTFFNYCLIYGKFFFPRLEIQGAALATVIARSVEFILMSLFMFRFNPRIRFTISSFFKFDKLLLKDYKKYSLPVVVNESLWGIGTSIESMIVGRLGTVAVAAFSINSTLQQMAFATTIGVGSAIGVLVGKEVGQGNMEKAHLYSRKALKAVSLLGLIGSLFILVVRVPFIGLYNISDETRGIVMVMSMILSAVFYIKSFNYAIVVGILRSSGDTKFAMMIDVLFLWFVALPLGALAAFVFSFPVWAVYMFFVMEEVLKMFFGMLRIFKGNYAKNVTRNLESENVL